MEQVKSLSKSNGERLTVLDSLRGVAALCVVLFHFTYGYDNGLKILSNDHFYFRYGYLGVQLFFMISGFVILMTLGKARDSRSFLVSRFSRLYPAYWSAIIMTLLITTLLSVPFQEDFYSLKQVLVNFTMLQYWFHIKDVDGAYWTLAVEFCFYIWMWLLFKTKQLKNINRFALCWIVLSFVFHSVKIPYANYIKAMFILQHAPLFTAGMAFYKLCVEKNRFVEHILIFMSLVCEYYILYTVDSTIIPYIIITSFFVIFYLFINQSLGFLSNKILLFMGYISYSLYLIHENIGMAVIYKIKQIADHQLVYIPITMSLVIAMAYCITKYIERPAMQWIRRYFDASHPLRMKDVHKVISERRFYFLKS